MPKRSRRGIPSPETVVSEAIIKSPKGETYRVVRTTQMDAYESAGGNESSRASAPDASNVTDVPKKVRRKKKRRPKNDGT